MKQNAALVQNKRAIQYAIHDHLDLVTDHPKKVTAVINELIVLLSSFYLAGSEIDSYQGALHLLLPLSDTIKEYFEFFEPVSLQAVVVESLRRKIEFFQKIKAHPDEYVARVRADRLEKKRKHQAHQQLVKRRRLQDKVSQLPVVDLSVTQLLVIENLMGFLTTMTGSNLMSMHGFGQLDEEEQASHCITRVLDHKLDGIPLKIYLEKGHVDKLLQEVEIDEGKVSLWYLLTRAADGRSMSSSLDVMESLLCNFESVFLDNEEHCKLLAQTRYYHDRLPFVAHRLVAPGKSVPHLMCNEPQGVKIVHDHPRLFDASLMACKVKMLSHLSRQSEGIALIKDRLEVFDEANSHQQRAFIEGLSYSEEGMNLILSENALLDGVEEYHLGAVVLRMANTSQGIEVLHYRDTLFSVLSVIQQRRLLKRLSESREGVRCLNANVEACLPFFDDVKELVLSETFLINIINYDDDYEFYQRYLLSSTCRPCFASRFENYMEEFDPDDAERLLYELSLTKEGVSFLSNQLHTLRDVFLKHESWLFDEDFMKNIFKNDTDIVFFWSVYFHPEHRKAFLDRLSGHASMQVTFLNYICLNQQLDFLLSEPRLLYVFKPNALIKTPYGDQGRTLAQYLKSAHPGLMADYPFSARLTVALARRQLRLISQPANTPPLLPGEAKTRDDSNAPSL